MYRRKCRHENEVDETEVAQHQLGPPPKNKRKDTIKHIHEEHNDDSNSNCLMLMLIY